MHSNPLKRKKRNRKNRDLNWVHVYPDKDLKKHYTGKIPGNGEPKYELTGYTKEKEPIYVSNICDCNPYLDIDSKIIVHNAWDCREAVEEAQRILQEQN